MRYGTRTGTSQTIAILLTLICLIAPITRADNLDDREGVRKKSTQNIGGMLCYGFRGGYLGGGNFNLSDYDGTLDWKTSGSYSAGVFLEGTIVNRFVTGVAFEFSNMVIDEFGGRKFSTLAESNSRIIYEVSLALKYDISSTTSRWAFRPYGSLGVGAASKIEPFVDRSFVVTGRTGVESVYRTQHWLGVMFDLGLFWLASGTTRVGRESSSLSGGPAPYFRVGFVIGNRRAKP